MNIKLLLVAALLAGACDKETATPVPTTETTAPPTNTVAPEPGPPTPAPATLAEADVKTLLDTWLATQNSADFAGYSALYALKFEGIKRVGARKSSYDRGAWLKDRERMFAKKVEVSAASIEMTTAGRSAVVRFEQTWASGNFKDVGPKQLVVVSEGDSLHIAREEMLSSMVVGRSDDGELPAYDPRKFALMVGPEYVILRTSTEGVSAGTPRVIARDGEAIADVTQAPAEIDALVGTEFAVQGGEPCKAKVVSLHVIARATPHFGQIGYWEGEEEGHPKMSDVEVAKEIWELAANRGHVLVGKLDKSCNDGAFAHAADSAPTWLDPSATTKFKDAALARFRALPGYKVVQKDYVEMERKNTFWDGAAGANVTEFGENGAEFVSVRAFAGDGCGYFHGEFWALFEVSKNGDLVLLTDPKEPGNDFEPVGAVRVDGEVMFFSEDVIVQKVNGVWRPTQDATIPYFDCPC